MSAMYRSPFDDSTPRVGAPGRVHDPLAPMLVGHRYYSRSGHVQPCCRGRVRGAIAHREAYPALSISVPIRLSAQASCGPKKTSTTTAMMTTRARIRAYSLSLIHISEPTRLGMISYA